MQADPKAAFIASAPLLVRPHQQRPLRNLRPPVPSRVNATLTPRAPPATDQMDAPWAPAAAARSARTNRGRRYTNAERDALRLHGRVPPGPALTLAQDVARVHAALLSAPGEGAERAIVRYEALMHVLERDEALFFATAQAHLRDILPMIYTPAVGTACLNYSRLNIAPRGLWIGIDRAGSIDDILADCTPDAQVIVVTDGERILGLGDLAANGHGIPVGKLLLYSACGGVDPARCLPVTLDVGCDNEKIREDPFYIGLRQPRVRGEKYDAFIEEFMRAAVKRFGPQVLIQFEDFGNANALRLLNMYKNKYCSFNDDIQGTAAVALAGVLSALRMKDVPSKLSEHRFLFLGAGSAGIGIADLIVQEAVTRGITLEDARRLCYFVDSRGLVYNGRENISSAKAPFAHDVDDDVKMVAKDGLAALVRTLKPTALIGVSTIFGAFNEDVLREMCALQSRPLIFALSNPTSKAECTAEEAYAASNGLAVFASGSPFDPVTMPGGKTLVPGQGNNAFCFPGIGLGVVASSAKRVTDNMILAAARRLSELVDDKQLDVSCVYPPLEDLIDVSAEVAHAVAKQAVHDDVAPPSSLPSLEKVKAMMYVPGQEAMIAAVQ